MAKKQDSGFGNPVNGVEGEARSFRTGFSANRISEAGNTEPENGDDSSDSTAELSGIDTISASELADGGTSGDGFGSRKRRGRPVGSRNTPKQAPQNLAQHLEQLLMSVHLMGATFFSTPELALDESEAKALSDAIRKVAEYYPISIDPKKVAIANLSIIALGIYGTRAVAIYKKQSGPKLVQQPAPTPINRNAVNQNGGAPMQPKQAAPNARINPHVDDPNPVATAARMHTSFGVEDESVM